ncbi:MAG: nucleoside hydrolase [Oscillospiraceae bacterium]|jgi:purine nucleosidase
MDGKRPVILDCDAGIDDALALLILSGSRKFDLRAVCASHGNASLDDSYRLISSICQKKGIECVPGAERAMIHSMPRVKEIRKGARSSSPQKFDYSAASGGKTAWELMYSTAKECGGELEIVVTGPMTDLATAVLEHPQIVDMIKCVWAACGTTGKGNITPKAEFNIWQDPHAAEVVLEAGFRHLVFCGMDACGSCEEDDEGISSLVSENEEMLGDISGELLENVLKRNGKTPLDAAVCAAVACDREMASVDSIYIICESQSVSDYGRLVADWNSRFAHRPNVELVCSVDPARFISVMERTMKGEPEEPEPDDGEEPLRPDVPEEEPEGSDSIGEGSGPEDAAETAGNEAPAEQDAGLGPDEDSETVEPDDRDGIPEVLRHAEDTAASDETVFFDLDDYDRKNGTAGDEPSGKGDDE